MPPSVERAQAPSDPTFLNPFDIHGESLCPPMAALDRATHAPLTGLQRASSRS
jgi:hypothetical protein